MSKPLAAAAVTMLLWASAFIAIRAVGADYSPGAMALGRLGVGAIALTVLVLVRRSTRLPRGRALALTLAYGAAWFGGYTLALNTAERHLDAGTSALLVGVGPVLIAVLAGVYLKEGFPRGLMAGLVIAFGGVVTIGSASWGGHLDLRGVALALVAAVLYAIGVVLQKQALATVTPLVATWLGCVAGAVVCLPWTPALVRQVATAPPAATLGIVYMGLLCTATAFLTWSYALAHMSAGSLASSTYVVPAIAVLLSWALLSEVPTPLALAGGVICLTGVAVSRLRPAPRRVTT